MRKDSHFARNCRKRRVPFTVCKSSGLWKHVRDLGFETPQINAHRVANRTLSMVPITSEHLQNEKQSITVYPLLIQRQ